jgi:two-component system chemotaxis response regulator CheY
MHALAIDDSRAMRMILGQILKALGFEVTEAANGKEALERLKYIGHVDVALVDWNMPEMSGIEFVRAVRADDRYGDIRLMMVTTENEMSKIEEALQAGADEYVMKPFSRMVIREKLELLGVPVPATAV